jgi:hypothetical protein
MSFYPIDRFMTVHLMRSEMKFPVISDHVKRFGWPKTSSVSLCGTIIHLTVNETFYSEGSETLIERCCEIKLWN